MRFILSLCAVLVATQASAEDRGKITAKPPPITQLLIESDKLKVLNEDGIQKEEITARRLYGISYSQISADRITLFANDRTVNYATDRQPAIGAQIGYMPLYFLRGFWGLLGDFHYTYLEQSTGDVKTALHWSSASASLAYRYEPSSTTWLKPYLALGGGSHVVIQRGPSFYNTSEAKGVMLATLGVNLNLSRIFRLRSPLQWELNGSYQKHTNPSPGRLDFNGDQTNLGLEMAL